MNSDNPHDPASEKPSDEIVDAEVVDTPATSPPSTGYIPPVPDPNYTEHGVPTFDFVRDKIENRISTAIGSQELAESTPEGKEVDDMLAKRNEAAKKKLDEIRKSMGKG